MTHFIIWEPSIKRLRFVRTPHPVTVKQLRRLLNLSTAIAQIFPMNQQKYNYLKEVLK